MIVRMLNTTDHISYFILRLTIGFVILPHGLQKLFGWFGGHGFLWTIDTFGKWFGFPAVVTTLVILAESLGACWLILGFLTRFTAFSIGVVMLGAIYFVTGRWGFFMNWYAEERGEGFEFHLLVLGIAIVLVIMGGGRWSLDRYIMNRIENYD